MKKMFFLTLIILFSEFIRLNYFLLIFFVSLCALKFKANNAANLFKKPSIFELTKF